ncbi:MAG: IS200/IS605 family element transposase accessory protein TnpB [Hydrococcus sp. C42_A2020_068]|nr:IS200/IS605 family element transposase accessory protein TnpB [Hydrococcus sp. C42_A2020_068]
MAARRKKVITRTYRVFLSDVNVGKQEILKDFVFKCRDITQYFVDLFWQRQDFTGKLADLPTVHKAVKRFEITTRLSQALAKQAKEVVRSQYKKPIKRKPNLKNQIVTLYYHFVTIEKGQGSFDWVVKFIGSGAPRLIVPVKSTKPLNQKLQDGWNMSKTLRLGIKRGRLYIDFLVEKEIPLPKTEGVVVGMDSNYKNGLVFSDGQTTGNSLYKRIQQFGKRQKHTKVEAKSMIGAAFKQIDFSQIKTVVVEDLKKVKHDQRGTFSRVFNRRLSHWLYKYSETLLQRKCEELGIEVIRKNPWKTSQFCRQCFRWDRRNRKGDKFLCVNCGHAEHADFNASKNLELLGLLGFYGIHDLQSSKCQSFE